MGDEPLNDTTRRIYLYRVDSTGTKIKVNNDIGTLSPMTGVLKFKPIPVDEAKTINIYCSPASNDIVAKRNNLIQIDSNKTKITGDIDSISVGGILSAATSVLNKFNEVESTNRTSPFFAPIIGARRSASVNGKLCHPLLFQLRMSCVDHPSNRASST